MGAGQSTTQKITNEISNRVNFSAENVATASQSVTNQNIIDASGLVIEGDVDIRQSAEMKAVLDAYIESRQAFTIDQETINDIAAKVSQEVPNLSFSLNVQDVNQKITNILSNEIDLEQIVRSSCDIVANQINQVSFRNSMVKGDFKVTQTLLTDVTAKCLMSNQQYAEAMQKIKNTVDVASQQTVKDIITAIIAIIVMGLVVAAIGKASASAVANDKFTRAAEKNPTLWIVWALPILLSFGLFAAFDCGGVFPIVRNLLDTGIDIPPAPCIEKYVMKDVKKCKGFGPFKHSCKTVVDPKTGKPKQEKRPKYRDWAFYLYLSIFGLIGLFVFFQIINYFVKLFRGGRPRLMRNSRARVDTRPSGGSRVVPTDVVVNYADF